jgi:hypothetical protein
VIGTVMSLRVAITAAALALSPALWFYRRSRQVQVPGEPEKIRKNTA